MEQACTRRIEHASGDAGKKAMVDDANGATINK